MVVSGGKVTRRAFTLSSVGALATLTRPRFALADEPAPSTAVTYRSRPDLLPPLLRVDQSAPGTADGYVLVAPFTGQANGSALIVDDTGEPVWIYASPKLIMNFRVQTFHGEPVLTWWEGAVINGYFEGECVIADQSYRVVKRFGAGNGFAPEVHEFQITDRGTALISINNFVSTDLTGYDGPADGTVVEGVIQELDLTTGEVLLEWHSLQHVALDESLFPVAAVWDYFHLNSIDVDAADDNLVVSARYPSTVYKLDRRSGEVLWRLGGKKSDFELGPGAMFWFQHDARAQPGGLLSLFDDGADSADNAPEPTSRAIVLALDTKAMAANLVEAFQNPTGASTAAMGSAQLLAGGGVFVGWGTVPQVTEFGADGTVRFDATFPGGQSSYRAFRQQWPGRAQERPALAAVRGSGRSLDVYTSWNGATRVSHWRILGGPDPGALVPLRTVPRAGFETHVRLAARPAYVAAIALDAKNGTLGSSAAVRG